MFSPQKNFKSVWCRMQRPGAESLPASMSERGSVSKALGLGAERGPGERPHLSVWGSECIRNRRRPRPRGPQVPPRPSGPRRRTLSLHVLPSRSSQPSDPHVVVWFFLPLNCYRTVTSKNELRGNTRFSRCFPSAAPTAPRARPPARCLAETPLSRRSSSTCRPLGRS